jgi:hypothetical protein
LRGVEVRNRVAGVIGVGHALEFQALVLVQVESLVAILEDRHNLEGAQVPGDLALVYEETCEEHKWNNQHGSKGNSQLLVREGTGDNQRVSRAGVVNEDQDGKEHWELIPVNSAETDWIVHYATENNWCKDTEWEF